MFAFNGMKSGAFKFVRHLVGTGNTEKIGFPQSVCPRNGEREGFPRLQMGQFLIEYGGDRTHRNRPENVLGAETISALIGACSRHSARRNRNLRNAGKLASCQCLQYNGYGCRSNFREGLYVSDFQFYR